MEEYVIRSTDTDPESVATFQAAESVYHSWCREHDLRPVPVVMVRVRPDKREFVVCDKTGGTIWIGEMDSMRPFLEARGFL
jgi:hypothetical protein